jgi:TRAP-type C4-dicarboxylate transport system permease small subunit
MAQAQRIHIEIEVEAEPPPPPGRPGWVARINTALFALTAIPAALLVLAEIAVLLAGIIGRYVFHSPLVWSDELAGILFLWLAMLGSVLACATSICG